MDSRIDEILEITEGIFIEWETNAIDDANFAIALKITELILSKKDKLDN